MLTINLRILSILVLSTGLAAQGTFSLFGAGCQGTGCASGNAHATTSRNLTQNSNIFCLGIAASPQTQLISGFELFTGTVGTTTTLTINTQLYLADSTGLKPGGSPVATGTMKIGSTLGWYKTTFSSNYLLSPNKKFFLSYTSVASQMLFPITSTTDPANVKNEHYWHTATATAWSGPFNTQPWGYRVNCVTGGAAPILSVTGLPTINTSFSVRLASARKNGAALLFVGLSNTAWAGGTLPQDLKTFNAPGCTLYVSLDFWAVITADANGMSTTKFAVPNDNALKGLKAWAQYVVDDKANPFGMVFSNAVAAVVN